MLLVSICVLCGLGSLCFRDNMRLGFLNHEIANVHSAALLLGAAGLLSRLLGVLRDRILAATFGAGRELDIYYAAFQIPDFMSVVLLAGGASSAVLPIFQEYLLRDKEGAQKLISGVAAFFLWAAVVIGAAAFFLAPWIVRFVVPGFPEADRSTTMVLTRIMLLSPVLLGLSTIFSAVTQSFQRFWAYALAPIFYNLGIIVGAAGFVPIFGIKGLAGGVVLGALLHFLIQWSTARQLGFAPILVRVSRFWREDGVRRVVALSFPRFISISFTNLTILALVAIGSTLEEGSIAVFQFAHNLYFVPIGIFGVSYAVAIFPRMSRAYIARDAREFFHELYLGIRTILFWIIPVAVLAIVLRAHIVRVALGAGFFSWEDTRLTAAALGVMAFSMFAGALAALLIKGFYALENTWRPLFINVFASLISVSSGWILARELSWNSHLQETASAILRISDIAHPEVLGLAGGFSLGLILNILLLSFSLGRFADKVFKECHPFPWRALGKMVLAALLGGAAAYGLRVSFSETLPLITFFQVLWQGAASAVAGFGVYFAVLYFLGSEEVASFITTFRRRLFRVGALPSSWDGETHI